TAGLPYSNGRLHVGHIAGAHLPADIYARYLRARGDEVTFICGSDDHGVAALLSAKKEGRPVEELVLDYRTKQAKDFADLKIAFDIYGGTHKEGFYELHEPLCQSFFAKLCEKGYLVKKEALQLYDEEAEQFLPDRYVRGTCYHPREGGGLCGFVE